MSDSAVSGQLLEIVAPVEQDRFSWLRGGGKLLAASIHPIDYNSDFSALSFDLMTSEFQRPEWLSAWFETLGSMRGVEGYWVKITDSHAKVILAMPLIRRMDGGLRVIEAPDLGICDYNAPLLASEAGRRFAPPRVLWRLILDVLPAADIVRIERMPEMINNRLNPLVNNAYALPSKASGWLIDLPDTWEEYIASLSPKMQEKLRKSNSRFNRQSGSARHFAETPDECAGLLKKLNALQKNRICGKGMPYILDEAPIAGFYDTLARRNVETGAVKVASLSIGEEVVAVGYGVVAPGRITYLRLANCYGVLAPFSLGLLVTEHMIRAAHQAGIRLFNFGIGEYEFKKRFGARQLALFDIVIPRTVRGYVAVAALQIRRRLSRIGWLKAIVARWRKEAADSQD